jgi:16S rRNA (adenine1518-N6/adenine1519-N6)-dimethyltransferase
MTQYIKMNKTLGQHWLSDEASLSAIVRSAQLQPGDQVLEIGPGLGTLTNVLLKTGANVMAVEFDRQLYDKLNGQYKKLLKIDPTRIKLINQDILKFDLNQMPAGYKVVANIPYYLTSHLVRLLSESANPPERAVLLVQKEVAERITAEPGSMSLLSVTAQYYWETSLGIEVPAKLFTPPPKVDSQVVIMHRRTIPGGPPGMLGGRGEKELFRVVKAGFSNKRKTLLNSLAGGLQMSKEDIAKMLKAAGIDSKKRPQELSMKDWFSIYLSFKELS